ncbi:MAG: FAD binding domain-containing protein [Nannocystaceae bacterium]|nr:FAD binding domain-containing protein [bacterium]
MIVFPTTIEEALAATGTLRAGGTELQERRRLPGMGGDLVDLRDTAGLDELRFSEGGELRIGAKRRIAEIGGHPEVKAKYPGFAEAVGGLATPQIREVGTMAGNLLQRTRCWYFRAPETGDRCFKRGGNECSARGGDHLYHACFDLGPCVSVHPSTIGMAMLAYDGVIEVASSGPMAVAELYGDGSNPRVDHGLPEGAVVTALVLPPPRTGEHSAYFRAISRARSEWPLVEALARVVVEDGTIAQASVALGGVAPVPLRAPAAEAALLGKAPEPSVLGEAARAATEGAAPLPMTRYKVELVVGTVLEALERAFAREPVELASSNDKLPRPAETSP